MVDGRRSVGVVKGDNVQTGGVSGVEGVRAPGAPGDDQGGDAYVYVDEPMSSDDVGGA